MFKKFLKDENGTAAIEYALIGTLVGLAIIGSITSIGTNTTVTLTNVSSQF